jgi:hypothetical protein
MNSALELLHHVDMSHIVVVSQVHADSIFRVEVCRRLSTQPQYAT